MMKVNFILYVKDQALSRDFYQLVLTIRPTLDVPGMTEFTLDGCILGIMPEAGIKTLLGDGLPDVSAANGIPRSELYLTVKDPSSYHNRALRCGARELSALTRRNWGDLAAYCLDPDGHVVAFACRA